MTVSAPGFLETGCAGQPEGWSEVTVAKPESWKG